MKMKFCVVGATRGTGLLIAQQLLQAGSSVRVLARNPDKARRLLGNRVDVCHGDVTDAGSVHDAMTGELGRYFLPSLRRVGSMDAACSRQPTHDPQCDLPGTAEPGRCSPFDRFPGTHCSPIGYRRGPVVGDDSFSRSDETRSAAEPD